MPYCCVPFCRSRPIKGSGIPFHEFPIDEEMREKWLICISREGTSKGSKFIPNDKSNSSLVCGLHFRDSDYKFSLNGNRTNKLNKSAYPTRFLNYSELHSEISDRKKVSKNSERNSSGRTTSRRKRKMTATADSNNVITKIKVELSEPPCPIEINEPTLPSKNADLKTNACFS